MILAFLNPTHRRETIRAQFLYNYSCFSVFYANVVASHGSDAINSWLDLPPPGGSLSAAPMGQNKRRHIDAIDETVTGSVGEGLIELEVLSMSGECMLTLNVSDSMLGRDLWKRILDKVPCKPGLQLVVSHTSRLVLHESLQQQGLGGQRAQVSATYMPVNLLAALLFVHGCNVEDEEFTLNGITEVTGVSHEMPALLHNLPKSLRKLTFACPFNQGLHDIFMM